MERSTQNSPGMSNTSCPVNRTRPGRRRTRPCSIQPHPSRSNGRYWSGSRGVRRSMPTESLSSTSRTPILSCAPWSKIALYECRMALEGDLLEEPVGIISTGLGGAEHRLRYLVAVGLSCAPLHDAQPRRLESHGGRYASGTIPSWNRCAFTQTTSSSRSWSPWRRPSEQSLTRALPRPMATTDSCGGATSSPMSLSRPTKTFGVS